MPKNYKSEIHELIEKSCLFPEEVSGRRRILSKIDTQLPEQMRSILDIKEFVFELVRVLQSQDRIDVMAHVLLQAFERTGCDTRVQIAEAIRELGFGHLLKDRTLSNSISAHDTPNPQPLGMMWKLSPGSNDVPGFFYRVESLRKDRPRPTIWQVPLELGCGDLFQLGHALKRYQPKLLHVTFNVPLVGLLDESSPLGTKNAQTTIKNLRSQGLIDRLRILTLDSISAKSLSETLVVAARTADQPLGVICPNQGTDPAAFHEYLLWMYNSIFSGEIPSQAHKHGLSSPRTLALTNSHQPQMLSNDISRLDKEFSIRLR